MELKEVFQIIKRKLFLLALIVIVIVGAVGYWSIKQKEGYETSSIITVQGNRETSSQYQYGGYYSIQSSDLFINTILGWVSSQNFVADVYKNSNIEFDNNKIKSLSKNIYARKIPPQNIELIVTESSRETSGKISQNIIDLIKEKTGAVSLVANSAANFEIISSDPITIPVKPNLPFNIVASLIVALALGVFMVFFIEYLSPTVNNTQRLKNIFKKYPISLRGIKLKRLVSPDSKEAEKFRFLRANITSLDQGEKTAIIVAGINEKNITPLISANLALSFARSGKKTLLIDANFTNPNIHEYFGRPNEYGFSEFLFDEKNLDKYEQKTDEANLKIISSGIKLSYASDTIERANLNKVFEELEKEYEAIIINVPTLNSSSEAFPLFSIIKKTLLVTRLGRTNISAINYINSFLDKKEVEKHIVVI